jgi:hypothetical protein
VFLAAVIVLDATLERFSLTVAAPQSRLDMVLATGLWPIPPPVPVDVVLVLVALKQLWNCCLVVVVGWSRRRCHWTWGPSLILSLSRSRVLSRVSSRRSSHDVALLLPRRHVDTCVASSSSRRRRRVAVVVRRRVVIVVVESTTSSAVIR